MYTSWWVSVMDSNAYVNNAYRTSCMYGCTADVIHGQIESPV